MYGNVRTNVLHYIRQYVRTKITVEKKSKLVYNIYKEIFMKQKDFMVRVKQEIYHKLILKRAELITKNNANFTMSEVIEILLLEAGMYERMQ